MVKPKLAEKSAKKRKRQKLPPNVVIRNEKWYVRVRYKDKDGKMCSIESLCEPQSYIQALMIAEELKQTIEQKRQGFSNGQPPLTFSELCTRWAEIELKEAVYQGMTRVAGRKSIRPVKTQMEVLRARFGQRDFRTITYSDIKEFKDYLLTTSFVVHGTKTEKFRTISTVNRYLQTFRQILLFAVREGWLHQTPFRQGKPLISLVDEKPRTQILVPDEEAEILRWCCGQYSYMRLVVLAGLYGGMRPGELLKSRWRQVDFERREILLYSWITKTGRERIIPLVDQLYDAFLWQRAHKEAKGLYAPAELIIGYKGAKKAWEYLREKINRPDLQLRDLRTTCGTMLAESGAGIKTVADFLGHASTKVTERHYVHTSTNHLRNAIEGVTRR